MGDVGEYVATPGLVPGAAAPAAPVPAVGGDGSAAAEGLQEREKDTRRDPHMRGSGMRQWDNKASARLSTSEQQFLQTRKARF